MDINIEKRPGIDWIVAYLDEDGNVETRSVYGAATIDQAIADARSSFGKDLAPAIIGAGQVHEIDNGRDPAARIRELEAQLADQITTVGVLTCQSANALARASEAANLVKVLDECAQFAVLFLAFDGRDRGTPRHDATLDSLVKLAVTAHANAAQALAKAGGAKP